MTYDGRCWATLEDGRQCMRFVKADDPQGLCNLHRLTPAEWDRVTYILDRKQKEREQREEDPMP